MTSFLGLLLAGIIRYALYFLEAVAVLLLLRVAFRSPRFGANWFRKIELAFGRLARRRGLAILTVGLLALTIRAALLPILPPRLPHIADDLAYLLAGDTFALGRVTNPTHPMWVHFESLHILQKPTYMSMYFPAQGLFLAAGKVIAGHPWVGVWLSVGLMCSALVWMLQAWLPPAWALLGGLLAVMRLGLFGYWMNSYFGGAVPALGGALVLGALPRIIGKQRVRDAVLLALGLAILANSRPYEGLFLALPVGSGLAVWLFGRNRPQAKVSIPRVVLPVVLVLASNAVWMGYYNWRVTGNAFLMPQQLQREDHAVAPYFIWQSPKPEPMWRHQGLRDFYAGAEMEYFRQTQSLTSWVRISLVKVRDFWLFFLGPVLTLPLVMLPRALWDRKIRFLLIAGGVSSVGLALSVWFYPQYAAPMTALLYAVLLQAMRHLRVWKSRGRAVGLLLARGLPLLCLGMVLVRVAAQPLSNYMPPDLPMTWFSTRPGGVDRARILADLSRQGGNHLALVRWTPGTNPFEQWVYNEPNIDSAKVVWAWEMDAGANEKLIRYFDNRRVWLVEPYLTPVRLSPYPAPGR